MSDEYSWLFEESSTLREGESFSLSVDIRDYYEPVWTTKNGDKIALSKMETRHICNCINLLESKRMYKNKWYKILKDELERRRASKLKASFSL